MKEHNKKIKYGTAIALGFFDGIHLGHRAVIGKMIEEANKDENLLSMVYTFNKNPASLFGKSIEIITPNIERYKIMREMGVEKIVEDDFENVRDLSPKDFVSEVLVRRFNAKKVFCGFNYHFGKGGKAHSGDLKRLCSEFSIEVTAIPPVTLIGDTVSSTRIRSLVKNGEIENANLLLGHCFGFSSQVEEGNHIGRKLNTPTINQKLPAGLVIPKFGVYSTIVTVDGKKYPGVTNIGVKPTIGNYLPLSETWILNYSGESLYGKEADIRLINFQRPEKKFSSIEELREQIKNDGHLALINIDKCNFNYNI